MRITTSSTHMMAMLGVALTFSVTAGAQNPANANATCEIKDEWINKHYDSSLDYQNTSVKTDFFLLVYSNAKEFCKMKRQAGEEKKFPLQCGSTNNFGWVIHGLWGESTSAFLKGDKKGHPRFCKGDLGLVPLNELLPYLCMSPETTLLQGEWEKHGACDFNTPSEYFKKEKELYEKYETPPSDLDAKNAVAWLQKKYPELKDKSFYIRGGEYGICYSTAFDVMSCPEK